MWRNVNADTIFAFLCDYNYFSSDIVIPTRTAYPLSLGMPQLLKLTYSGSALWDLLDKRVRTCDSTRLACAATYSFSEVDPMQAKRQTCVCA